MQIGMELIGRENLDLMDFENVPKKQILFRKFEKCKTCVNKN
jgi:hypothetical protein